METEYPETQALIQIYGGGNLLMLVNQAADHLI
jgi:hypothetical protein